MPDWHRLGGRAIDFWNILDHHKDEMHKPMERAGRKASSSPFPPRRRSPYD